jgi:hypothetical protein
MSTRHARLITAFVFALALLSFSTASAQDQKVFSTRSGESGSYELSSAVVISPDLWRDYFARPAWVASETPVTVRVLDAGDFYVRVIGPNLYDTSWFLVTGSYTFTPSVPGDWTVDFGRQGLGFFREDFVSVSTVPIQNVVIRLEDDVNWAVSANLLPPEDRDTLIEKLQTAEHRFGQGKLAAAVGALQSFIAQVERYVEAGTIKWALGQLWINAANYVMQH